jgi:hypothetical protein
MISADPHSDGVWNMMWTKRADEDSEKHMGSCKCKKYRMENYFVWELKT